MFFLLHVYYSISIAWGHSPFSLGKEGTMGASSSFQASHGDRVKTILAAHLFGETAVPYTPRSAGSSAPITSFEVRGTFAGLGDTQSYAIIVQPGQQEKPYRVGDALSGATKIEAIYADRVIINDGTSKQILYLKTPQ